MTFEIVRRRGTGIPNETLYAAQVEEMRAMAMEEGIKLKCTLKKKKRTMEDLNMNSR